MTTLLASCGRGADTLSDKFRLTPTAKENSVKKSQIAIASAILFAALANAAVPIPAHALTMKECSAKYEAAKKAGTLKGMKWNEFRKAECGKEAAAAPAVNNPAPVPAPAAAPAAKPAKTAAPAVGGNAVFPSAVDPKYSKESAGIARRKTCLDQYNKNKVTNANGGLKWIEKGGGYYSVCNTRLKGSA
jgi:hypothetical protein